MTRIQHGQPIQTYATLGEWIANEAIPFSLDSPTSTNEAVDRLLAAQGEEVELLGFGEALHGGEELLLLRNRIFQRLVEAHHFSAIAVESSFPRGHHINEYVLGGDLSYEMVQDVGFSHGFGALEANRELIEWMRHDNSDPARQVKVRFYGFDSPTEMYATDSPSGLLHFVLDYLAAMQVTGAQERRQRIDLLLGDDAAWENPAALMDPSQSIGLSPEAAALRIETEELISELQVRRPALAATGGRDRHLEAMQYAMLARQMLTYHAGLARESENRVAHLLGIRDVMMAENLEMIAERERSRGRVFAFAHNSHLRCGRAQWQLGPMLNIWWPAGAHLRESFGPRYVVIGTALGVSEQNGIVQPEPGTLEQLLTAAPGPARLIATHLGSGLPAAEIAALPVRSGSAKNPGYFALSAESLTDFDWLLVLDSATYARGGPPLPT
jgi:erythromycin esterase-like protein